MIRSAAFLALLLSFYFVQPAPACTIGVYASPDASGHSLIPQYEAGSAEFSVYVVVLVNGLIGGTSYGMTVPGLQVDIFDMGFSGGGALDVTVDGELLQVSSDYLPACLLGGMGNPILVAEHRFMLSDENAASRWLTIGPNPQMGASAPLMIDCFGPEIMCDPVSLLVEMPVANVEKGWGAVKSLYAP